jgi:sulfane dehydrogenase subunit SoxC
MTTAPERTDDISLVELQLAARNHGFLIEALAHDVTPVGMHYLLTHYDVPLVDPAAFSLEVGGLVERPLHLTLDDLRGRPAVTAEVTMECAGNGRVLLPPRPQSQPWLLDAVGTSAWTGTPLAPLLLEAGVTDEAVELVFTGMDRGVEGGEEQAYERSLTVEQCEREEALLVYALNGAPLPPQHGFPLRLLVPGWYGMTSVKWLHRITAVAEPFTGYQQARAYRLRQEREEDGAPVQRIAVRALLEPPGIPEFPTRHRFVDAGEVHLAGRAWSGSGRITRVELSADGGETWWDAEVADSRGRFAWHRFTARWDARPGEHVLCARATDVTGATQPLRAPWNLGGYMNNAVQRVPVTVR